MKNSPLPDQSITVSVDGRGGRNTMVFLKHSLLLTIVIFLLAAPQPDSNDITDISANFIVPANQFVRH